MAQHERPTPRSVMHRRRSVGIVGASGFLGRRLTAEWVLSGADVRCLVRSHVRGVASGATSVICDLEGRRSVVDALRGLDVAYYLVHAMADGGGFAARDRRYARRFARAARTAGVRRVVYVGGLAPSDGQLSAHLASRTEVGMLLMRGCDALVVRAGVIVGSGSASWILLRDAARFPLALTPSWAETRCQPTGVDDLVLALRRAADLDGGRVVDVGGREVLTYRSMVDRIAQLLGSRRLVLPAPFLPTKLAGLAASLITDVPLPLVRALVDSLPCESVCDGVTLYEEVGVRPRSFSTIVRRAIREDRRQG
jgi:uncharacterized protein YbjT (DUF2867 family)